MNSNNLTPIFCNYCNKANSIPRIQEYRTSTEIIKEAKWVCPNCGALVRRETISREPIRKD